MSEWGLTTRVHAVVTLGSGSIYPGYLHLLEGVHPGRSESPLEMLNRPGGFFPLTLDDGSVSILSKAQVAMVAPEWPAEASADWAPPARRAPVVVTLSGGERLRGEIAVAGRVGHNRPIDVLNGTGPFFELAMETGPRLLHGAWVAVVHPVEEGTP